MFDVQDEFSTEFYQGTLVGMHVNKKADAYLIFLFDEYPQVKKEIKQAPASLEFADNSELSKSR